MADNPIPDKTTISEGIVGTKKERPEIPDHELLRPIGGGSYGEVWLAKNALGAFRAVKVVYRKTFESERPYEREFSGIKRFEPISRSHEGFVDILQVGRNDEAGYFYYVMELADDGSELRVQPEAAALDRAALERLKAGLHTYVPKTLRSEVSRRGRLSINDSLTVSLSLTSALGQLHRQGLIHRDIKPSNIIFVNGVAKLADIGLVASVSEARSFVGTEGFIPPEGPGTAQADLYSLGKVLYEMTTGKDRIDFPELPTLVREMEDGERLMEFNEVVLKACHHDLQKRYRSAEEMHADLALLQSGKSVKHVRQLERRLVWSFRIAGAAGAIMVAGFVGHYFYEEREKEKLQRNLEVRQIRLDAQEKELGLKNQLVQTMTQMQLRRAEEFFEADDARTALAILAQVLRYNPSSLAAAERILSALTFRNFALPEQVFKMDHSPRCARLSADGQLVAIGLDDRRAIVREVRTGRALTAPLRHEGKVLCVSISPDGRWVATGSTDKTARIWNVSTGEQMGQPMTHTSAVYCVQFTPDGQRLASCTEATIRFWKSPTGEPETAVIHGQYLGADMQFSWDGKRLVTVSGNQTARIWNATTGEAITRDLKYDSSAKSAQFSWDGERLFTVSTYMVRVLEAGTGEPTGEPVKLIFGDTRRSASIGWSTHVRFRQDGLRLVIAADELASVFDTQSGKPVSEPFGNIGPISATEFSMDGQKIMTASSKAVCIWDVREGRACGTPISRGKGKASVPPDASPPPKVSGFTDARSGSGNKLGTLQFSGDGQRIIKPGTDKAVRIWDARSGLPTSEPFRSSGTVVAARFEQGGQQAIIEDGEGGRIWENLRATAPIPEWLAELAESVGGKRISIDGTTTAVGPDRVLQLKGELGNIPATNIYGQFVTWFFADRSTRAITPVSREMLPEFIHKRIDENSAESLREAYELSASNAFTGQLILKGIAPRNPGTDPRLLDLSKYYNASISDAWQLFAPGSSFVKLPSGVQRLGEIDYDLRGVVELEGQFPEGLPKEARAIPLGQKCGRLHILHSAAFAVSNGTAIASCTMRYADGARLRRQIIYGEDVSNWWFTPDGPVDANVVWVGRSVSKAESIYRIRVFHTVFENPKPEIQVDQITFASESTKCVPLLFAITSERPKE